MKIKLTFTPRKGHPLYRPVGFSTTWPFDFAQSLPAVLTTDHPASSYGRPVLVIEGHPYGPADTCGYLAGGTEPEHGIGPCGFLPGEHEQVLDWFVGHDAWRIASDTRPGER